MAREIETPPRLQDLPADELGRLLTEDSETVLEAVRAADRRKGYLHWDQFRRRPAPDGWSPQDLWRLVILTQRRIHTRRLPLLLQKDGSPFRIVRTDPLQAALSRIDRKERLRSVLGRPQDGDDDIGYRLIARIDEAHHSSAIEGAVTTRRRSLELIQRKEEPRDRSERMVLNNFEAIQRLKAWSEVPLTQELICEIQATVTEGTLDDDRDVGRMRTDDDVRVLEAEAGDIVYEPPTHKELARRMTALCRFANEEPSDEQYLHPLTRATLLHHQLAYDHPFGDGNGRTARTLFLWSALRSGYSWFQSLSISRSIQRARDQYYRSFRYVQTDGGDTTYFVRSQLWFLEQEIDLLAKYLERLAALERWLSEGRAITARLNERQLALFEFALDHESHEFTVREHMAHHGVSQPTGWSDLEGLVKDGLLDFVTRGRTKVYTSTEKLRRLASERPAELRNRDRGHR